MHESKVSVLLQRLCDVNKEINNLLVERTKINNEIQEEIVSINNLDISIDLSTSCREIGLSPRASNGLKSLGIITIADLIQYTEEELLRPTNVGSVTMNEIKEILNRHGFSLKK